jgi:LytS/YehU family sensor histidine kinase
MANELSESRIKIMVSQMRPHFVRSALGAIRSIIKSDPEKAYDLLYDFTSYLSFNIDTLDNLDPVPFRDELRHIREYVTIEQERFYPRVRVEYEIEADSFMIPPLSIQPFVENAIRHGILAKREGGMVRIVTEETEDTYIITVADNGEGYDPQNPPPTQPSHGISARNATYRLESTVGAVVDIQSKPGMGTTVTVTVPKERRVKQ